MNRIKNDLDESCSSNQLFLRENHFQKNLVTISPQKLTMNFLKCPIFNGSVENFGNSLGKNKYIGLVSHQIWSSSSMPKFLKQS